MFVFCLNNLHACASVHTHESNFLQIYVCVDWDLLACSAVEESNSSAGNRGITESRAVQLEDIKSTNDGSTLPCTPL